MAALTTSSSKSEMVIFDHSSWIRYADYEAKELTLQIGFRDGRVVEHTPVYPQTFLDFKLAPSKGRFYLQAIKAISPAETIK